MSVNSIHEFRDGIEDVYFTMEVTKLQFMIDNYGSCIGGGNELYSDDGGLSEEVLC